MLKTEFNHYTDLLNLYFMAYAIIGLIHSNRSQDFLVSLIYIYSILPVIIKPE